MTVSTKVRTSSFSHFILSNWHSQISTTFLFFKNGPSLFETIPVGVTAHFGFGLHNGMGTTQFSFILDADHGLFKPLEGFWMCVVGFILHFVPFLDGELRMWVNDNWKVPSISKSSFNMHNICWSILSTLSLPSEPFASCLSLVIVTIVQTIARQIDVYTVVFPSRRIKFIKARWIPSCRAAAKSCFPLDICMSCNACLLRPVCQSVTNWG